MNQIKTHVLVEGLDAFHGNNGHDWRGRVVL